MCVVLLGVVGWCVCKCAGNFSPAAAGSAAGESPLRRKFDGLLLDRLSPVEPFIRSWKVMFVFIVENINDLRPSPSVRPTAQKKIR